MEIKLINVPKMYQLRDSCKSFSFIFFGRWYEGWLAWRADRRQKNAADPTTRIVFVLIRFDSCLICVVGNQTDSATETGNSRFVVLILSIFQFFLFF